MPAAMRSRNPFVRVSRAAALLFVLGCRQRVSEGTEADPYEGYRRDPSTAGSTAAPRASDPIQPGVLVPTQGALTLTWGDTSTPMQASIPVADGGLRVGDLATFAYPTGFVRFAVKAVQASDETAGAHAAAWLADEAEEPRFLLLELRTVSDVGARLDGLGVSAEATAVLGVQLGARLQEIAAPVRIEHAADGAWRVSSVAPQTLNLEGFGDATARARFAAVAPGRPPTVHASVDITWRAGTSEEIPVFVRPAITLQDATGLPLTLEREVDDYEEATKRIAKEGVSVEAQAFMTRERHGRLRGATRAIYQRWQGSRQAGSP